MQHEKIEKNIGLMIVLTLLAISFGGLVEIVPLFFLKQTTEPITGLKPLTALQLEGRDIYIREGCVGCHSQMIRPLRAETERYGHYSVAGESVYEHPFLWGSKRTGPDLARVGGRYSDDWQRAHLFNPRDVVPESNMPLSLIHISEPTRLLSTSYAVFCLKKKIQLAIFQCNSQFAPRAFTPNLTTHLRAH